MKIETEFDLGETVYYGKHELTVIEIHISEERIQYTCRREDAAVITFMPSELGPLSERTLTSSRL